IIGFMPGLGAEALGGFLAGATVTGVLMGMFQNNAGGAWDNAKKSFEKGVEINGQMYYKKSEPHKASVTGDTVGDPFKDTSGPSMNILIKLMSIVSLVIAPTLADIRIKNHEDVATTSAKVMSVKDPHFDQSKVELVKALEAAGLLNTTRYELYVDRGNITINGHSQSLVVNEKFRSLTSSFGNSIVELHSLK
ncbi:MAG: sodium/proton-translocating pyrophosphatase, partial [Ferruginibacter sp.]